MPQSDPSRTERATPKRRRKAREKGNVPKGQELAKTLIILAGLIGLVLYIHFMGKDMMDVIRWYLSESVRFTLDKEGVYSLFKDGLYRMAKMVLPVLLLLALVAYITQRLQVGPLWTTQIFTPKFNRVLNPLAGLKRMFGSIQTLIRLGKSLAIAVVIGFATYLVLKDEVNNILPLFYSTPDGLVAYILVTGAKLVSYALVPMILIAAADAWYARWDYEENLKMTKDEIKDERKQMEGDPVIKQKQREKMFEVMRMRMLEQVPKADVVITNPTHLAIALRYDPIEAPAPVVLAKGAGFLAEKIKEIAREHHIPIRENKPLAQALYKTCEIGDMIPNELYQAVAAILAQLFKFRKKAGKA